MAGDWTPIDDDLPHKPEVHRIVTATGTDIDVVVGRIVRFWLWVDRHGKDDPSGLGWGLLPGCGPADLARQCGGQGEFWSAVAASAPEWLRFEKRGACIPGFDQRFSKSAKRRMLDNARKSEERADKKLAELSGGEAQQASPPAAAKMARTKFPCLAAVTVEMLCSASLVVAWVIRAAKEGLPGIVDNRETYREVLAAAKWALKGQADNPAAKFVALVKGQRWSWIGDAERNWATTEMRRWDSEIERSRQLRAIRADVMKTITTPAPDGMVLSMARKKQA